MAKSRKSRRKTKKASLKKRFLLFITLLIVLIIAAIASFIATVNTGWFGALPGNEQLKSIKNETATRVYSSDNQLIGKYFSKNRTQVQYHQLPEHLINALIATEDVRYFQHEGFDSKSYLRVFFKTLLLGDRSAGGGSTITQQLAKNLFGRPSYGVLTMPVNKVKEAIVAYRLEKLYSKKEILQLYFNTVPFGENLYGIEAAANRYFNTTTGNLNIQEAAVLVGILKANTYYNPRLHPDNALRRRNLVLSLMKRNGFLDSDKYEKLVDEPLGLNYANLQNEGPANYFLAQVKKRAENIVDDINKSRDMGLSLEKSGLKIITTLDSRLQKTARQAIKNHLQDKQAILNRQLKNEKHLHISRKKEGQKKNRELFTWKGTQVDSITEADSLWHYKKMLHAGVLSTVPQNGAVKVWIGGNHYRYLPFDLITARRTAASAFKPLLYAAALHQNLSPCDYLSNKERIFEEYEDWFPKNYDGSSGGFVALWYALAHSMNIPTVDLYLKTDHAKLDYLCRNMGFEKPIPKRPSVALGALDVSLTELVTAYSTFAAHGKRPEMYMIERIEDKSGTVLYRHEKPEASFQAVNDSLSQIMIRMLQKAAREGTGKSLFTKYGLSQPWASKTGTSQNYSDARFMVFSKNLVTGIWVGAYDPDIHFSSGAHGSGATLALPIAAPLLQETERKTELLHYSQPPELSIETDDLFDCDGKIDRKTLNMMLDAFAGDIMGGSEKDSIPVKAEKNTEEKKESKVKRFFKKLFGGSKQD